MQNKQPIPNSLRAHRKRAGLRQLDVARMLRFSGMDRISLWEQGKAFPNVLNLLRLSVIYGVPPEELYPDLLRSVTAELRPPLALRATQPEPPPEPAAA